MSDYEITNDGVEGLGESKKDRVKAAVGQAGEALKQEAQTFAAAAQSKARDEAQRRAQMGAKTLGDFANAVRRAGEELAQADQSPASKLVRQAADGLENISRSLADKGPDEMLSFVRDFGRRHPAAFIGGAVLVGVAAGRFLRATDPNVIDDDYDEPMESSYALTGGAAPLGFVDEPGVGVGIAAAGSDLDAPFAADLGDLEPTDADDTSAARGADPDRRGF